MKHNEISLWVAQQDWSKGYAYVAAKNGISYETAASRARRHGAAVVPQKRGRKKGTENPTIRKIHDVSAIDWSLRDVDIAKQRGVSRERIRQIRLSLGIPKHQRLIELKEKGY